MNMNELRMINPIENPYESETQDESEKQNELLELTEETADAIAEPIQPKYLMLKPEQYNLLAKIYRTDWESHCKQHGFDIRIADSGGHSRAEGNVGITDVPSEEQGGERITLDEIFNRAGNIQTDGEFQQDADGEAGGAENGVESTGYESVENAPEMGAGWSDTVALGINLAADIAVIAGGGNNDNSERKRPIRERKHGQKKKQDQEPEKQGYNLTM